MDRHFTATGFVCFEGLVALHWHSKVKAWLPPGGHIMNNEDPEQAVIREIKEELDIIIDIENKIAEKKYKDEKIDIVLHHYLCSHLRGSIKLNEHEDLAWVEKKNFNKFDFVQGDKKILALPLY